MTSSEKIVETHSTLELDTRFTQQIHDGTATKGYSGQALLDHSDLQPYHPQYTGCKDNESGGLETYRPGWTNEDEGIILAVAEEENGKMVREQQAGYDLDKIGAGEGDMNAEEKPKSGRKRIFGLPAIYFYILLALILIGIIVGVVAGVLVHRHAAESKKYGAYITDCDQSETVFYTGAASGKCYQTGTMDGFEVSLLKATCTATVYTDIYCSYNATGVEIDKCYTGYESFSIDTCY